MHYNSDSTFNNNEEGYHGSSSSESLLGRSELRHETRQLTCYNTMRLTEASSVVSTSSNYSGLGGIGIEDIMPQIVGKGKKDRGTDAISINVGNDGLNHQPTDHKNDSNGTPSTLINQQDKAITNKVDWRILPILCLMYTLSYIDRANIGFAKVYGLEESLNLTPSQFGLTISLFFVGYMIFQIPSNLMLKKMAPNRWFSIILIGWGLCTIFMAKSAGYYGLLACRLLLGVFEAGLFPGVLFCTGLWYSRNEQGFRIALITSCTAVASSLSGIIAYAIHNLDGTLDLKTWQWLFIIEGLPTVLLGLVIWKILPSTPHAASFLTDEERNRLVTRLQDDHVELEIEKLEMSYVREVLLDCKIYLYIFINLGLLLPGNSTGLFLPSLVESLGFGTLPSILLTIPPNLIGLGYSLAWGRHSDHKEERGYHLMFSILVAMAGFVILLVFVNPLVRYGGLILINGGLGSSIALTMSWVNNNFVGTTRSAIAPPLLIMMGCFGGMASGFLYRKTEASTNFLISNLINLASLTVVCVLCLILRYRLKLENRRLDSWHKWEVALNSESKIQVVETPKFRYIL